MSASVSGVVVVIPYRGGGCEHRRRALYEVHRRYVRRLPRAEFLLAPHDAGEWCKATAVAGVLKATDGADIVVIADADVWAPSLIETIRDVRRDAAWGSPHTTVRRLTRRATDQIYRGIPADDVDEPVHRAALGGGIVVLRREVLADCPLDPRFLGWGGEDVAWGFALRTLFPEYARGEDELEHFWHPAASRRSRACGSVRNEDLRERYRAAALHPDHMRALIAEAHT